MSDTLLRVEDLKIYYPVAGSGFGKKEFVKAVDGVTFEVKKGEVFGIVGESGCGKSTLGRGVCKLENLTSGHVYLDGEDITEYNDRRMRSIRKKVQMVFQDPYASLNPRMTVSETIGQPMMVNKICRKKSEVEKRVAELMDTVGLASRLYNAYPHELDGGRRQRIGIARALSLNPKFIVCDEPVSALDVSIQAQILNLMQDLQDELDLTYMFITHDLSVVKHFSNQIMVMYLGQMVEKAPSDVLFQNPVHPYTKALLSAIPLPDPEGERGRKRIRYNPLTDHETTTEEPEFREVCPGHFVRCTKKEFEAYKKQVQ